MVTALDLSKGVSGTFPITEYWFRDIDDQEAIYAEIYMNHSEDFGHFFGKQNP
jgi:hypothetical protein